MTTWEWWQPGLTSNQLFTPYLSSTFTATLFHNTKSEFSIYLHEPPFTFFFSPSFFILTYTRIIYHKSSLFLHTLLPLQIFSNPEIDNCLFVLFLLLNVTNAEQERSLHHKANLNKVKTSSMQLWLDKEKLLLLIFHLCRENGQGALAVFRYKCLTCLRQCWLTKKQW